MSHLIDHTRWMAGAAGTLATATLTLHPIANSDTIIWQLVGVLAAVTLGISAWCGVNAAKVYVVVEMASSQATAFSDLPADQVVDRATTAKNRGRVWALVQQIGFLIGAVLAGTYLVTNMLTT